MNLMPRVFKNAVNKLKEKKPAKQKVVADAPVQETPTHVPPPPATTTQKELSHCPAEVVHPFVGDWVHHLHGQICCKCGTNATTGEVLSDKELDEFRKNYW